MWSETIAEDGKSTTNRLAHVAAAQHGVLTSAQLARAGLRRGAIEYRLREGGLYRLHRGVYCLGYMSGSAHTRMMAAVLACGPGALLSHRSAGWLWQILPAASLTIDVTAPGKRAPGGLCAHRSRNLHARHVTTRDGIPITTVARTLIDLAGVLDLRALGRALNEARVIHKLAPQLLARELAALPKPKGGASLRALLALDDGPTRSALEDRFLELVARHRLPRPDVNRSVAGYEVDMLWRDARLIVELDGRRYHDTAARFECDRAKDADLLAAGYRVMRITWRRLLDDGDREAARLRALLRLT